MWGGAGSSARTVRPDRVRIVGPMNRRSNTPHVLLLLAPFVVLAGAMVLSFTGLEWRGLLGWGLIMLGVAALFAGVGLRARAGRGEDGQRGRTGTGA